MESAQTVRFTVLGLVEEKCPAHYTNFHSFKSHIYKKHRTELFGAIPNCAEDYDAQETLFYSH